MSAAQKPTPKLRKDQVELKRGILGPLKGSFANGLQISLRNVLRSGSKKS